MTLPPDILKDLEDFKSKLPTVVKKKRVRTLKDPHPNERPPFFSQIKPDNQVEPKTENVRKNGKGSWLVMVPTGAAYRGLKTREDPVVRDAPITKPPYNVSHMDGNTARVCTDAALFKRPKK